MKKCTVAFLLFVCAGCPVLSADEDTTMKDDWKKPLVLTYKQVRAFREFVDLLLTSQKKLQKKLMDLLPSKVSKDVVLLHFEELTDSTVDRKTSAGIFIDDLQKFAGFEAAMKLVIKSSKSPRRSNIPVLSRQIREVLVSLGSAMMKVLKDKSISPPPLKDYSGLERRLDCWTRTFLKVMTSDSSVLSQTVVHDVRDYVIVSTFAVELMLFSRDLWNIYTIY